MSDDELDAARRTALLDANQIHAILVRQDAVEAITHDLLRRVNAIENIVGGGNRSDSGICPVPDSGSPNA